MTRVRRRIQPETTIAYRAPIFHAGSAKAPLDLPDVTVIAVNVIPAGSLPG